MKKLFSLFGLILLSSWVGADTWPQEGHDAQRTFRTADVMKAPLSLNWSQFVGSYDPRWQAACTIRGTLIAADKLYFTLFTAPVPNQAPRYVFSYNLDGSMAWNKAGLRETPDLDHCPAIFGANLFLIDDGIACFATANGKVNSQFARSADLWGETLVCNGQLYFNSRQEIDNKLGISVISLSSALVRLWVINNCHTAPVVGKIAADNGMLFVANNYSGDYQGISSGLYAFNALSGDNKAVATVTAARPVSAIIPTSKPFYHIACQPMGNLCCGNGMVYALEAPGLLSARRQADGSKAWSVAADATKLNLLLSGNIIISGSAAYNAQTGALLWRCDGYLPQIILGGSGQVLASGADGEYLLCLSSGAIVERVIDHVLDTVVASGGVIYGMCNASGRLEAWAGTP